MKKYVLILLGLLLMGCSNPQPPATPGGETAQIPQFTPPVLAPTFTPLGTFNPPATFTPPPNATVVATTTPIPFDEKALELRYTIPALGLDRRLEGNIASQIVLVDETSLVAAERPNQSGVLLEMRQALSQVAVTAVPADCMGCVQLNYNLYITGQSGSGWLQDPTLLASLENYFATYLGPHFPPGTVLGLRRSATPFAPAHTLALAADGRLWLWLATEAQVSEPVQLTADSPLFTLLAQLPIADLGDLYNVECPVASIETLYLNPTGEDKKIRIICPSYSLPTPLQSLYVAVDELLATKLADVALPSPPYGFPLAAVLDYKRADGNHLTLFQDGSVTLETADLTYTTTLTTTTALSLTSSLLESGILQPGLTTFQPIVTGTPADTAPVSTLLVRWVDGVYDGKWANTAEIPALAELDALLNTFLALSLPQTAVSPTPESTPTIQP